ncbi:MAG TPA: hypothetical protein VGH16_16825 [Candidatus Binatia bacterium]|jgi:hypothetical protein
MSGIREFRREDIPDVAKLWLRVFRSYDGAAPAALSDYFEDIFFNSPWQDRKLPSLVYEDDASGPLAFLGVMPRKMVFRDQPVTVAVATQLAEDERARSAYAAVKLVKAYFSGPQDLSYSDGANDSSERLWRASGGDVALLYSLNWTRVLRPAQYARVLLERGKSSVPFAKMLPSASLMFDALVLRSRLAVYWKPEVIQTGPVEEPGDEILLSCIRQFSADRGLRPEYDLETFRWLLKRADEKRMYGKLRKRVLRESNGEVAGWYLYYVEPGRVSEVLEFGGRPKSISKVLSHLIADAWNQGAVAISGEMEPRYARELGKERCQFVWTGGVLAQSRNAAILQAVQLGDAFLSRLEGEWWARFSDPGWTSP